MTLPVTPSQTVGPYFAIGLSWLEGRQVVAADAPGAITIAGAVHDGTGAPVVDAVIETWQADPPATDAFCGFHRAAVDGAGRWQLRTLRPGPVAGPDGTTQAPHLDVSVFARGLLHRVVTRLYFADEVEANAGDPVLRSVSAERRATLLAERTDDGYRFDIHLQGPHETVFFDI